MNVVARRRGRTSWPRTVALTAAWAVVMTVAVAASALVVTAVADTLARSGATHATSVSWAAVAAFATLLVGFPVPAAWLARLG